MLFNSVHDSPQLQSGVEVDASQWNLERMVECSGQPSLATIFSITYRHPHLQICSILFQFHNPGSSECASFWNGSGLRCPVWNSIGISPKNSAVMPVSKDLSRERVQARIARILEKRPPRSRNQSAASAAPHGVVPRDAQARKP